MSYDIKLIDPVTKEVLQLEREHFMRGGTYAVNGTTEMWLNITYNYAQWYRKEYAFGKDGIRSIYGLSGAKSIPLLKKAILGLENSKEKLPEDEVKKCLDQGINGYWLPTRENSIKPLYQLLAMAELRPDGIWDGD